MKNNACAGCGEPVGTLSRKGFHVDLGPMHARCLKTYQKAVAGHDIVEAMAVLCLARQEAAKFEVGRITSSLEDTGLAPMLIQDATYFGSEGGYIVRVGRFRGLGKTISEAVMAMARNLRESKEIMDAPF